MRVLYVDDAVALALEAWLAESGREVLRAPSLAEAARLVRERAADLVAVDGPLDGALTTMVGGADEPRTPVARFLDLLPDGFCTASLEGRFLTVNKAFERTLGWSAEELLAFDFAAIVHPDDVAATAAELARLVADGAGGDIDAAVAPREGPREGPLEVRLRTRDGGWCRVTWTSRYFADEGVIYAIARDVTAKRRAEERLRHSEAVMAEAQRIGRFGSWDLHVGGPTSVLRWSDETYRIFGHAPGAFEVTPERFFEQVHPDDREAVRAATQAALDAGQRYAIDHRIVLPDGRIRHVHEAARPASDLDSGRRRLVGTVHDITVRKEAEVRLAASEQRARYLSRTTNDAIWFWDLASGQIEWNEGFAALFGAGASDSTVEAWSARVHPDDRDDVTTSLTAAIEASDDNTQWQHEYRFARADAAYAWVLDRGFVIRDDNGRATHMLGGMTDVTRMHEADARIREQAALLDKARDAILVRDLDDRVIFWNQSAERLYGWTAEEAIGRPVTELIYPDLAVFGRYHGALLEAGEWAGELQQTTRDGRRVIVEGRWTLVRGPDGEPRSVLAINTDVTERKKLEAQFLRAQRMESIGTLAGGIAHDLNNVLAPILMSVELLRMAMGDSGVTEILNTVETSARRGADLVRQVLSFARGVEGERVVVDPRQLVREVSRIALETMSRQITVDAVVQGDAWGVLGDPTQLHQVLINLCVNARDAMPDGGTLRIATENVRIDPLTAGVDAHVKPGPFVAVAVSDNGYGMSAEVLARIFEPFFTTKPVGKGTGLGLATVQAIVKSHGGWITVYSEPGEGSMFRVYLPAAPQQAAAPDWPAPVSDLPRGDGQLLLVVDDEAAIRMITRQTLETFGYRVITAQDGAEALALFVQHGREVAAVLTDMMMPIMDGTATIRALQRLQPDVRIIAASGLNANGGVAKAAGAGVRHFLPKPYTAEALLKTVVAVLADR